MNWLQLSDLHIKDCADWEMMKKAYQMILSNKKIDFIIITGDLHNYSEDYTKTKEFLDEILSATGLDKKSLFIIPGNHDSKDFKDKKLYVKEVLGRVDKDSDCYREYENDLKQSFDDYVKFYREYFIEKDYELENVKVDVWNDKINIIKLNTALISDGKNDHKQIVDIYNFSKLEIKNSLPTIVLGHHTPSCLFDEHHKLLQRKFTDLYVSAYFCGDLHKDDTCNIQAFGYANHTIPCVVCGKSAIDNTENYSDNSFIIYECEDEASGWVTIHLYTWSSNRKNFCESNDLNNDDGKNGFLLNPSKTEKERANPIAKNNIIPLNTDEFLRLHGYVLIGPRGINGIKYIWIKNEQVVESLAFNKRLNSLEISTVDKNISAYTSSISNGCILQANSSQCIFCETGNRSFRGYLTSEDIALQNIFMAEYDSDCPSYPEVRTHSREFSYMGQGEPGHAYHLIRKSILLTDYAMKSTNQNISRYIISSCGICDFIPLLINDIKQDVFKNKISLHFSLNAIGDDRNSLMPINKIYNYLDFIKECELFYDVTKEKVAVSLIIFNNLVLNETDFSFTLSKEKLHNILKILDPLKFRIDLRDFSSNQLMSLKDVSNEYATNLLNETINNGFEAKLFSCFGESEKAACGMLASALDGMTKPGKTTIKHYDQAIELLKEAKKNV